MHDTNTRRHDLNINTHGMLFTQGEKTRQMLTTCTTNSKKQAYPCMALNGHSRHDLNKKEAYSCMVTHGMLPIHTKKQTSLFMHGHSRHALYSRGKTRQLLTACTTNSKKQTYSCMVEILTQEGKAKQG
jgi:hypothetical protein